MSGTQRAEAGERGVWNGLWALATFALIGCLAACGVGHIGEYVPKNREYVQPVEPPEEEASDPNGSVFPQAGGLLSAVSDVRALKVNDVVVIKIVEVAQAERSAATDVDRDGGLDLSVWGGGAGGIGMQEGIGTSVGLSSKNAGRTARRDDVRFTVAATVKQKFPNGNLFVEGHRVVLVNQEEHHYYVSGVARPADIDSGNSIRSDRLADAHVELNGRGIISDAQEPGWITKFFKWISPF